MSLVFHQSHIMNYILYQYFQINLYTHSSIQQNLYIHHMLYVCSYVYILLTTNHDTCSLSKNIYTLISFIHDQSRGRDLVNTLVDIDRHKLGFTHSLSDQTI